MFLHGATAVFLLAAQLRKGFVIGEVVYAETSCTSRALVVLVERWQSGEELVAMAVNVEKQR